MSTIRNVVTGKGRTTFRLFSFFALLLVILLFCLYVPIFTALVVRDNGTNQLVWQEKVKDESLFSIRWTHSIHRTPVEEFYRVRNNQIVLMEMTFEEYGIGMDSALAPGEKLVMEDGSFHIINMNRAFPALHLFIGQVRANHTLIYAGKEIPLSTVDKPGAAVTIQVESHSIIEQIGGN